MAVPNATELSTGKRRPKTATCFGANASASAGRQKVQGPSNQQLTKPTLPLTQITGGKRADSGIRKALMASNLLKTNGAGDGTRTRDVQLGKLAFYH